MDEEMYSSYSSRCHCHCCDGKCGKQEKPVAADGEAGKERLRAAFVTQLTAGILLITPGGARTLDRVIFASDPDTDEDSRQSLLKNADRSLETIRKSVSYVADRLFGPEEQNGGKAV